MNLRLAYKASDTALSDQEALVKHELRRRVVTGSNERFQLCIEGEDTSTLALLLLIDLGSLRFDLRFQHPSPKESLTARTFIASCIRDADSSFIVSVPLHVMVECLLDFGVGAVADDIPARPTGFEP